MPLLALILFLFATPMQEPASKPVPKDSVEIVTRGCLKGRMFTATPRPEDEGVIRGPDVTGRHFRVAGPKDVMDLVKQHNGHLVEVVGLVRKSALGNQGVGFNVPGGRVVMSAPGGDPGRMGPATPGTDVPVMDLSAVHYLSDSCSIR